MIMGTTLASIDHNHSEARAKKLKGLTSADRADNLSIWGRGTHAHAELNVWLRSADRHGAGVLRHLPGLVAELRGNPKLPSEGA